MNERDFIEKIAKQLKRAERKIVKGIGDDCAVVPYTRGKDMIITTDSFSEDNHFSRKYFKPGEIGEKSTAAAISDICSMGGKPLYALVCAGFKKNESQKYAEFLYAGILRCCRACKTELIGGDTVSADKVFLAVTVIGEVERGRALLRSSARAGDVIYTTGLLGDSASGLCVLKKKGRGNLRPFEYLPVMRHIRPSPRLAGGRFLLKSGLVNACTDISDGLVNDIYNIASGSGKGAVIFADRLPVSHSCRKVAEKYGGDAVDYALYGGEDFELVFTVAGRRRFLFEKRARAAGIPVFETGIITAEKGLYLIRNGKKEKADREKIWNHF